MKAAAQECTAEAIETLKNAMSAPGAPWAARVSAANSILDRGWGKPKETVDITAKGPSFEEIVRSSFRWDPDHGRGP